MWNDKEITLTNFYELPKPSTKSLRQREEKAKQIIEAMGDKYCLYKSVERKDGRL
jgi:hypothetical protein